MANNPAQAVTLDPNSPVFSSYDAAANAVSKDFGLQKNIEQAAVVIKRPDGTFGYSTLAPQNTHDGFALRALLAKDHTLAAIVHSHPGDDDLGQVFSPDDLDVSNNLKVPSFIRFVKDNSIRKYTPGVTQTQYLRKPGSTLQRINTARGDAISLPPDPTAAQALARNDDVTQYPQ